MIKIIDQIPVSEHTLINVKLLRPALPPPNSNAALAAVSPSNSGVTGVKSSMGGILGTISGAITNSEPELQAVAKSVETSSGVVAQWDRPGFVTGSAVTEDDDDDGYSEPVDLTALGKDGKINWLCSVPAQTKTNLTLQWEVSGPVNANVVGI
ncbi:hypothetical protein EST38_g4468 [Candolleomyces aberdarensis]|uniref:Uncharacterized protein n=1 Tax=Candolleomyces aberdarensis TaxID=2316362 RepID=A0A4Q2DPL1_9AGAR|nr:hypothetical protein EST38_g4468 [Candolleomyces aberdarensis]